MSRRPVLATITPAAPMLPPDRGRLLTVEECRSLLCRDVPSLKWVRTRLAACPFVRMGRRRLYWEADARAHLVRTEAA